MMFLLPKLTEGMDEEERKQVMAGAKAPEMPDLSEKLVGFMSGSKAK
jgi:hypothetical protein